MIEPEIYNDVKQELKHKCKAILGEEGGGGERGEGG